MKTKFSRRFIGITFLIFLTAGSFLARNLLAAEVAKGSNPTAKCMMWKISSKTATVYVVGSMHVATPEMYPLPKEMEDAFAKSDTLVVELNINKLDQQKMAQLVMAKGMYAGDETLPGHLKKETWEQVKDQCAKLGLPTAGVEKFKPWLMAMTIDMLQIQKLGFNPALGIDKHFLDLAEKNGKQIDELETADFQINTLANFDAKLQEAQLTLVLADLGELQSNLSKLTNAWIAGDAKAVDEELVDKEKKHAETAEVMKKVIYDRNGPMATKIEGYLKGSKTVYVIVGDAHLVGDKGVIKILHDRKYKVEQSTATKSATIKK